MRLRQAGIETERTHQFGLGGIELIPLLQRHGEIVVRDHRVRVAPDHLAKIRLRLVEFGFLQMREPDVDARHIVGGIGLEDRAELGDAFLGAARY